MKRNRIAWALALAALLVPAFAYAETWSNVALVDLHCSNKVKADPDAHKRECAIKCADGGYGIWTADGKYLKFDAEGSKQTLAALKASDRADHLRVDVTGELSGDTIKVSSLALK